jgi:uncharacterized protein YbaR (Trm112 family)
MFIELTDHLRCPADHAESFLVLIPAEMTGRTVRRGVLGCPVCQREFPITGGVVHFGGAPEASVPGQVPAGIDTAAIAAFLGIDGPGGYVALVGDAAGFADGLRRLWAGIHLVAVNPPRGMAPAAGLSVLQAPRLPIKARALRGIILGEPFSGLAPWPEDAVQAVLPGLRVVGRGSVPRVPGFELLGEAEGWWVGRRR